MLKTGRIVMFGVIGGVYGFSIGACALFPASFLLGRMIENAFGWSNDPLFGDPGVSPIGGLLGFAGWIAALVLGCRAGLRWSREGSEGDELKPAGWEDLSCAA